MLPTSGNQETQASIEGSSGKSFWRKTLIPVLIAIAILFVIALSIPTMDGPNSRRTANEAVAVGKLRRIIALENEYATSHPERGFACQLALLKPSSNDDAYGPDFFLLSQEHAGYRTLMVGCEPEIGGMVRHYRIAEAPIEKGKSGVRTFCTDETGSIWFDPGGSAETCFVLRRML